MDIRSKNAIFYGLLYIFFVASFLILLKDNFNYNINITPLSKYIKAPEISDRPEEQIIKKSYKPQIVKGIYLTAYSAGNDEFRQSIIDKIKNGQDINAVVVDIKDYSGYILYNSNLKEVNDINGTKAYMSDVKKVLDEFHAANVYVIARLTVFQDPVLAKAHPELALKTKNGNTWYDKSGLAWMDPSQHGVWDYNLAVAKEAASLGFDEIQFDYMRYPSDGNLVSINYNLSEGETRSMQMDKFFKFLSDNLSGDVPISIDIFGLVLDRVKDGYDLGIGQVLTELSDDFDYVSPMMYPSHYPLNYLGFSNSAEHPGPVISYGLDITSSTMATKRAKLRPWIQAFNIGAVYDESMIDAEKQAVENVTTTDGWLLWNARNYYPNYIF